MVIVEHRRVDNAWTGGRTTVAQVSELLEIRLLGTFDVLRNGRPVTAFESRSERALLARLAADLGRPVPRAVMAELLWPERPEGAASANLRHCLSVLRRAIGDNEHIRFLETSRTMLTLTEGPHVVVDLAEFRRLASCPATDPGAVKAWERASELFRGPFLDGFELDVGGEWNAWVLATRARDRELAVDTLRRLAETRYRTGEVEQARRHVRRWLELDPWSEPGQRLKMRLLALEGEGAAALATAKRFTDMLKHDLGVAPDPETLELVRAIRHGGLRASSPSIPGLATRSPVAPIPVPCVGREQELRWLHDHLAEAMAGAGRIVFVVGQAGSGKSVLLHEFERQALERVPDLVVLRGTCNGYHGPGDPFLPFRQVLRQLTGDLEVEWMNWRITESEALRLWAALPDVARALLDQGSHLFGTLIDAEAMTERLARGFPDHELLARMRAGLAVAARRQSDQTRRQPLVEACGRVLTWVASRRRTVITIDDFQWADTGSVDALIHLGSVCAAVPLMVVVALRPGETGDVRDPAELAMNQISARRPETCRLDLVGSREFVDAWLDSEANTYDDEFRSRLHAVTGGNALFTVEIVHSLREAGQVVLDAEGRWRVHRLDRLDLPSRVEAVIAERVSRLSTDVQRDLEVASVAGERFSAEAVADVRGEPQGDVLQRLSGLCVAPSSLLHPDGIEVVAGSRVNYFRFRHVLFQQHMVDGLSDAVRASLHEAIARTMEESNAGDLSDIAADLAGHYHAAGLIDRAIDHDILAGQSAVRLSAYENAIEHLLRALRSLEERQRIEPDEQRELRILTTLGACYQAQHGYNGAETMGVYEKIRTLTARVRPSPESAAAVGALLTVDGLRARYLDALAGAEQLLDLSRHLGSPPIETLARTQLGWMLLMVGRIVEADEQLGMATDRYDPDWDAWLTPLAGLHVRSTALAWRSITAWHLGDLDRARRAGAEAIELARTAHHPFGLAFALSVGGCLLGELLEDPALIAGCAAEVGEIAAAEDLVFYRAAAELHAANAQALEADALAAASSIRAALTVWAHLGTHAFSTWSRTWVAEALIRGGDLAGARRELETVDRQLLEGEEELAQLRRWYVEGLLHRAEGDVEAAVAALRTAIRLARSARARGAERQAQAALDQIAGGE